MNIKPPARVIYSCGDWSASEISGQEQKSVDDPAPCLAKVNFKKRQPPAIVMQTELAGDIYILQWSHE